MGWASWHSVGRRIFLAVGKARERANVRELQRNTWRIVGQLEVMLSSVTLPYGKIARVFPLVLFVFAPFLNGRTFSAFPGETGQTGHPLAT